MKALQIKVQVRASTFEEERGCILHFRDYEFQNLAARFFREHLEPRKLDFLNMYAERPNGSRVQGFTKVVASKEMNMRVRNVLREARRETWGDVAYGL